MFEILIQVFIYLPNQKNTYLTPTITKHLVQNTTQHGMDNHDSNQIETLCGTTPNTEADYGTIMFKIQKSKCTFFTKSDVHCKVQNMTKHYNFSRLFKLDY
jgi:hypothetical protein